MNTPMQKYAQTKQASSATCAPAPSGLLKHTSGTSELRSWSPVSVFHEQTQSVGESVNKTRYKFMQPCQNHRLDRFSIFPALQPQQGSMLSSPPIGGIPSLERPTEEDSEEEGIVVKPIQVMLTSVTGAPIVKRQPPPVASGKRGARGTSTPDGGSAPKTNGTGGGSGGTGPAPSGTTSQGAAVRSLEMRSTGAIEGRYGISDYWPGVSAYWGADKTLGQFDTAATGGFRMFGHKFQVIGCFDRVATTGAGGDATFQQEARLTTGSAPPGTAGSWFDDMDYVDAGGGAHHWDPNAEAGTTVRSGYPGVRRTLASDTYAYTDPPAIGYQPGITNTYRKLEFKIWFRSAPGCTGPSGIISIGLPRVQEIQVTSGTPTVLKYPY